MATLSWVGGTGAGWVNGGTTITSPNTPSSLANGDGLFAFVHTTTNTTITPPAGWTQLASAGATAGAGYSKIYVFQKDTVTSGNSNTSYTFTAGSSVQLSLAYAAVRASTGAVRVESSDTLASADVDGTITIGFPTTTSVRNGSMFVAAAGTYWTVAGSYTPTLSNATGATQWTGAQNLNLLAGMYWPRNTGQATDSASLDWALSATDNGEVSVVLNLSAPVIEDTISEEVELLAYSGEGDGFYATVSETLSVDPDVAVARGDVLTDGYQFELTQAVLRAVTVAQTVGLDPDVDTSTQVKWSRVAADVVRFQDAVLSPLKGSLTVAETLALLDVLSKASAATVSQGVGVAESLLSVQAVTVVQQLSVLDSPAARAAYARVVAETIALHEVLARFFAGGITEGVAFAPALASHKSVTPTLAETTGLAASLGHALVLRLTLDDTAGFDDAQALRWLFAPTVTEGVAIGAAYVQPDGSVTTWAVNTLTAAVTEYTGYEFNSFARMGRRYLGASSAGLYLLDGDDDAGTDIIGALKTGLAQFAGSRFSGVKSVYLGMRGSGSFLLRIVDGAGVSRTYAVSTTNMRTTRVDVGKGIRTRYLSFELESTGQDFDLDTIEVIPLLAQRRV